MNRRKLSAIAATVVFGSLLTAQQPAAEKPIITKLLVANVWPGGYSEVYSLDSLSWFRAVSNIDFTVFEPAVMIETPDVIYDFFLLCSKWTANDVAQEQQYGSADLRGFPKYWPQQLPARAGFAQYLPLPLARGSSDQAERHLFDLLHRHYQANRLSIEAQARQREIDNQKATAAEAARRAAIRPHVGPPVTFKRIEYPSRAAQGK